MITGIVKTKEILAHSMLIIHEFGFFKYIKILTKGLSRNSYQFLPLIFPASPPQQALQKRNTPLKTLPKVIKKPQSCHTRING